MLSVEAALHIPVCVSFTRSNTLFSLKSGNYLCCVLYFFYTREFLWRSKFFFFNERDISLKQAKVVLILYM